MKPKIDARKARKPADNHPWRQTYSTVIENKKKKV